MNKCTICAIFLVIIVIVCVFMYITVEFLVPIKYAIKEENLNNKESYILVEFNGSTDEYWKVINCSDSIDDIYKNKQKELSTFLIGNIPEKFNYELKTGYRNTFVCYGTYINIENSMNRMVFQVDSWDIIYPINREPNIFSKKYLFRHDFI